VQELHQIVIIDQEPVRQKHLIQALMSVADCDVHGLDAQDPNFLDQLTGTIDSVLILAGGQFDLNGLCERIRQTTYVGPILVLSADRDLLSDEADEILPLPVAIAHLTSRIRAHIGLYESHETAELYLGAFVLKTGLRQLFLPNGHISKLTDKETRILRYLHRAQGQPVSREELLSEIWGYDSRLTTHTLETHIYRLRQKSEIGSEAPVLLLTEAGGYRLAV
jgi:DNA-binding response OmpR family regulator